MANRDWGIKFDDDDLKTQIFVPWEVKVCLFKEQSKIIRSARAKCINTTIEYENRAMQLVFGGPLEDQLEAMLLVGIEVAKMGRSWDRLVKAFS